MVWFYSDQAPCHPTNTMQFRPREFPALGRAPGARQLQMAARGQLATQAVLTCTDRTWDAAHRCTSYMDQSTEARQLRHNTLPDGSRAACCPQPKALPQDSAQTLPHAEHGGPCRRWALRCQRPPGRAPAVVTRGGGIPRSKPHSHTGRTQGSYWRREVRGLRAHALAVLVHVVLEQRKRVRLRRAQRVGVAQQLLRGRGIPVFRMALCLQPCQGAWGCSGRLHAWRQAGSARPHGIIRHWTQPTGHTR